MSITTKKEYLDQLHKYLKKLPREDYEDAMEYFTEYFEETDDEGAQKLMEELGTPKQAARDLIGNLLDKKTNAYHTSAPSPNAYNTTSELPKKRKNSHIIWIACLALLAAPIGGPLLLAAAVAFLWISACILRNYCRCCHCHPGNSGDSIFFCRICRRCRKWAAYTGCQHPVCFIYLLAVSPGSQTFCKTCQTSD